MIFFLFAKYRHDSLSNLVFIITFIKLSVGVDDIDMIHIALNLKSHIWIELIPLSQRFLKVLFCIYKGNIYKNIYPK